MNALTPMSRADAAMAVWNNTYDHIMGLRDKARRIADGLAVVNQYYDDVPILREHIDRARHELRLTLAALETM